MCYLKINTDQLWKFVCKGDEEALGELVRRLDRVILAESRVYGKVNDDVAQEIREKLIKAVKKELFDVRKKE